MTVHINHEFESGRTYGHMTSVSQHTVTFEAKTNGEVYERFVVLTVEGYDGDYDIELNEEDLHTLLSIIKSPNIIDLSE